MNFKDCINSDINSVFFNLNEFANVHTLDGAEIRCIVDDDRLNEQTLKSAQGTYMGVKLIHVPKTELKGRPKQGARLEFDGKIYTVESCIEDDGVFSITLDTTKVR